MPSKGNPSGLTVYGHVYPKQSIKRFADPATGKVSIYDLKAKKIRPTISPGSRKWFCAQWAWDQRAESGYMDMIEKKFQIIASRVVGGARSLSPEEQAAISRFFALWHLRAHQREHPEPDFYPKAVTPFAKELEETLMGEKKERLGEQIEKAGVSFIRSGGRIPGRVEAGLHIQQKIDSLMDRMFLQTQWGIVTAIKGEFVISDYISLDLQVVPVCPKICFIAGQGNLPLAASQVAQVNSALKNVARRYLISRDFRECQF